MKNLVVVSENIRIILMVCHSAETDYDMTYLGKLDVSGFNHARIWECPFSDTGNRATSSSKSLGKKTLP